MKDYLNKLEQDGILIIPNFVSGELLKSMQNSFTNNLTKLNFNSTIGFQRYEMYRDYVEDLLSIDPSFVKFAVNPFVMDIVKSYISTDAIVQECRGWQTRIVKEQFHAWHKDGWYDKNIYMNTNPPKQLKAMIYLTDVETGPFSYIKGSHRNISTNPNILHEHFSNEFIKNHEQDIVHAIGKAGTVIIFDTSGVHCQHSPNLSLRHAVLYTFNIPNISIDQSELDYGRYMPLLIRNEFIDDTFSIDQLKFLGFLQKAKPAFNPQKYTRYSTLASLIRFELEATIYFHYYVGSNFKRIINKIKKVGIKQLKLYD